MEEWKELKDYPSYFVNNKGQVKSFVKNKNGFILKGYNNSGYRCVRIFKNGKKGGVMIHRLVGFAFIPNPENKPFINHKNGIKHDNRVENLEWVTQSENVIHAYKNNLCSDKRGVNNSSAKIDDDIVRNIRAVKGKSITEISRDFNISWSCASLVIKGKTWSHVK